MTTLDDVFVADAVTHAYNMSESNDAVPELAEYSRDIVLETDHAMPKQYRRTPESLYRDWPAEDTANILFLESQTDFAVFHPQSITIWKDGLTSVEKAKQFVKQNPTRSAALARVDPIGMDDPHEQLAEQVDDYDPHGVKVYPSYWDDDGHHAFRMDDAETAFPLWEHLVDLGLDVAAVHKAVPMGSVPLQPYNVDDVDEAACSFPELTFEIVHGGMAFAEETGWQIANHQNVYVNLEITSTQAVLAPNRFVSAMEDLLYPGGEAAIDKLLWGSGATQFHPQLLLESFWEFDFPEMESAFTGPFTITKEHKEKILGKNLMEAHNLDEQAIKNDISNDQYSDVEGIAEPYSTSQFEVLAA